MLEPKEKEKKEERQYPGITSPISLEGPKSSDQELSQKLELALRPFGVFETEEELAHRLVYICVCCYLDICTCINPDLLIKLKRINVTS